MISRRKAPMPAHLALFGTGRMGTPIGAYFLRPGHDPVRWNRTAEEAVDPAALRAVQSASPNEGASGKAAEKGFRYLDTLTPDGAARSAAELAIYIRSAEKFSTAQTALQGRI